MSGALSDATVDTDGPARTGLVGRRRQIGVLSGLLDRVVVGQGGATSMVGPAGSGKTALLDWTAAEAFARSCRVLRTSGREGEADLPWAALSTLFAGHRELFERLPGPQRKALLAAFALGDADAPIDRLAVCSGVLGIVSALANDRPVVVVVDDIHWLDPESRRGLDFLARRICDDAVALVTAGRPDDSRSPAPELHVDAMESRDMHALLAAEGVRSLSAQRTIADLVAGNPLLAVQVAAGLEPAELSGSRPLRENLRVPGEVEQLYTGRLSELDEAGLAALTVVAAARSGDGIIVADALQRLGLSLDDLEAAEHLGLVEIAGAMVDFCHPLARSAVYQSTTPPSRRRAHAALAAAEGEHSPQGILHRAAAAVGADEALAEELVILAVDAQRRGAPLVAVEHWAKAAGLSEKRPARAERLVGGATAALSAGELGWAGELLEESRRADPQLADGLDARRVQVRLAAAAGHVEEAHRLAEAADAAWAGSDPGGVAEVLGEVSRSLMLHRPVEAVPLCERVWELAQDAEGPARLYAEVLYGLGRYLQGDHDGAARHSACWRELLDLEGPVVAGPFLAETVVLYFGKSYRQRQALEVLDRIEGPVRANCVAAALVAVLSARALTLYGSDLRGSVAASREAIDIASESGVRALLPISQQAAVYAAGFVGDEDLAGLAANHLLATGNVEHEAYARAGLAKMHLIAGRPDAAAHQFGLLRRRLGTENPTLARFETDEVETLVRVGRMEEARQLLPRLQASAADGSWSLAMYERALALVAEDLDDALDHWAVSAAAIAETDNLLAQGTTELLWGERLRRAKRRAEARRHLEAAAELLERIGATALRRRAEEELAAAGGAGDRSRPTVELLGPTELQVARMAVGGATNRDIATQLFISPRTVENHLGAVYRKLDVAGRSQLLGRAAEDPAIRPPMRA